MLNKIKQGLSFLWSMITWPFRRIGQLIRDLFRCQTVLIIAALGFSIIFFGPHLIGSSNDQAKRESQSAASPESQCPKTGGLRIVEESYALTTETKNLVLVSSIYGEFKTTPELDFVNNRLTAFVNYPFKGDDSSSGLQIGDHIECDDYILGEVINIVNSVNIQRGDGITIRWISPPRKK